VTLINLAAKMETIAKTLLARTAVYKPNFGSSLPKAVINIAIDCSLVAIAAVPLPAFV
jgi:hypothetical protein